MNYPSLFDLSYVNYFQNIDEFHLESMQTIDLSLWKKTFTYDASNQLITNFKYITMLYADLNKILKGKFYYSGVSFASKPISLGTIFHYYIQYLASKIFNNVNLTKPFNNINAVKNSINTNIENIIHEILDSDNISNININSIIDDSKQHKFLHLKIFINKPKSINSINIKDTCWHIHILMV